MKILVVRFRQIGDAILSSVICNSLRKSFPNAQIDYVLYDFVTPLFENHPAIDNVISIDKETRESPFKYLKFVWKVTRNKYDIVIDIMSTPKSELFTLLSPFAKFRIGRKKKWRGFTYTHAIPEPRDVVEKCDKFLKLLRPLEDAGYKINYDNQFTINITKEEQNILRERMVEAGIDFSKKVAAFAINSRRSGKVYPKESMKEVIKLFLEKNPDYQILFFYSPDEKEFALKMHDELNEYKEFHGRIFSNVFTKSIKELAMLIKNCNIFVGNEGGPRHLAQGLNTPSVGIYGPLSKKAYWLPSNDGSHIGIEPMDLVREGKISREDFDSLDYWGKYSLMTPEIIVKKVQELIEFINSK